MLVDGCRGGAHTRCGSVRSSLSSPDAEPALPPRRREHPDRCHIRGRGRHRREQAGRSGGAPGIRPRNRNSGERRCRKDHGRHRRAASRPGIVHRLDKDTSGVLIVAKNDTAISASLGRSSHRSSVRSTLALFWGIRDHARGRGGAPAARSERSPGWSSVPAGARRRRASSIAEWASDAERRRAPADGDRAHSPNPATHLLTRD